MTDFSRAFDAVAAVEGGFAHLKGDPGGRTMYGITERDHPDLWKPGPPTLEQARDRYFRDYWVAAGCTSLPWPLSLLVFDAAVNQGVGPAIRLLQKLVGVAQDGIFGRTTTEAVARLNPDDALPRYLALRALRYTGTRNFDRFGEGWLWRLFHLAMRLDP